MEGEGSEVSQVVAIQGQPGSYHEQAARQYFGAKCELLYGDSFEDVFAKVNDGSATGGVVAIENSLYGSIGAVYDLLRSFPDITITGETYLRIDHCLIVLPGATLDGVRHVHSQKEALGQCLQFLRQQLPEARIVAEADTAASVALVKQAGDPSMAAIASSAAAKLHGLEIAVRGVQDNPENYTRFLILKKKTVDLHDETADKTSLLIERLRNDSDDSHPGELAHVLNCFARANVTLTKIESRPIHGVAWRYWFYIDCAAGLHDPKMQAALTHLQHLGTKWKVLGTYSASNLPRSDKDGSGAR